MTRVGKPNDISKISLKGSDSWTSQENWQKQKLVKYLTDIGRFNLLQTTKQRQVQAIHQFEKQCLALLRNYYDIQTHDVLLFFFTKKASLPKFIQGKQIIEQYPAVTDSLLQTYPILCSIVPMLNIDFRNDLMRYLNNDMTIYTNDRPLKETDQIYQCALVRYIYENKIIKDTEKIFEKLSFDEKQLIENKAIEYQREIMNLIMPEQVYQESQFIDTYNESMIHSQYEYN